MHRHQHTTRLLIIDDDLLVRTLAAEALQSAGFDVMQAADGRTGLTLLEQHHPALVLLDVMMPGMNGFDVCQAMRGDPRHARIPVIMLTGLDDTSSIQQSYEAGATDFITKPINATLLNYRVQYALRASRMIDEIDRQRASLANAQRIARLGNWTWRPKDARFECSAEYQRITGMAQPAPVHHWQDILRNVHPGDAERVAQAMQSALEQGEACAVAYRLLGRDGIERTIYEQIDPFRDEQGEIYRIEGTTQDITDRVATEERIRHLVDYDGLTGMANRRLFSEAVQLGLNQSARGNAKSAVLDINIDRFKRINETLGHAAGDQVLKEVARRIKGSVRARDIAGSIDETAQSRLSARMSSDGFAVFLTDVRRAEDAAMIARRLIDAIARPLPCGEHELTLSACVGVAVYPDNGDSVGTLLKNAETAMRQAKTIGPGSHSFFTPSMNTQSLARLQLENDLRGAIARNELVLFYQARVDVPTGRLVGAEALVRWQHPVRGLVPPNEFIPMAEESGLITPLTEWVVRAACRQLQAWQQANLPVVPLSVNLSARSFHESGLRDLIQLALSEFGVAPSLLEGEITESVLMQDVSVAITRLHELREVGLELAIDDFGTGYSSLAYLKRFPLNVLKIDRAFVRDILTDTHDSAIASTIITLGKTMGLTVVAEGMETVEQANHLLSLGCRLMQGYLFARPVPAAAFADMLRDGIAAPAGLDIQHVESGVALPAPDCFALAPAAGHQQRPLAGVAAAGRLS